jgi:hypothetical protein
VGNPVLHLHLSDFQAIEVVCGALVTLLTLIGILWRWVGRPMWRAIKRIDRRMDRMDQVADVVLGKAATDDEPRVPPLEERLTGVLQQHVETLHRPGDNGRLPARPRGPVRR